MFSLLYGMSDFLMGALFWGILVSALTRSSAWSRTSWRLAHFIPACFSCLSGFVFRNRGICPIPVQAVTYLFPTSDIRLSQSLKGNLFARP